MQLEFEVSDIDWVCSNSPNKNDHCLLEVALKNVRQSVPVVLLLKNKNGAELFGISGCLLKI